MFSSDRLRLILTLGLTILAAISCVGCVGDAMTMTKTSHTRMTKENVAKVQVGMTRPDIEALLGRPDMVLDSGDCTAYIDPRAQFPDLSRDYPTVSGDVNLFYWSSKLEPPELTEFKINWTR